MELAAALGEKYGDDLCISVINSSSTILSVGNSDERKAVLDVFQRYNIRQVVQLVIVCLSVFESRG